LGLKIVDEMEELAADSSPLGATAARSGEDTVWERYFT